jgi:hypothetical protein
MRTEQSYINKPFQPALKDPRLQLSASHPWIDHSTENEKKKKKVRENILLLKKTLRAHFPVHWVSG